MAYELGERLVIGIASSAFFDLTESDAGFRNGPEQVYRDYEEQNVANPFDGSSQSTTQSIVKSQFRSLPSIPSRVGTSDDG